MELTIVSMALFAVIVFLLLFIRNLQEQHERERSELLDRLMSRNIDEYKYHAQDEPRQSDPVDLTEEEEWAREIEMMKSGSG